jgi:hypothetical protein
MYTANNLKLFYFVYIFPADRRICKNSNEIANIDCIKQVCCNAPPHRGPRGGAFQHLVDGVAYGMVLLYIGQSTPTFPLTDHTPTKHRRNEEIRVRYAKGETIGYLARLFNVSVQRVSQIIRGQRK